MAYTQEELTALFERNLSLQTAAPPPAEQASQAQTQAQEPITYSISQHYTHSAHIIVRPRPASVQETDDLTASIILSRHGVDVSTLFPSQIDLFKTADASQQMRLVELWRISPPNHGGHALATEMGSWPSTTMAQEEAMAQIRYERQLAEEQARKSQSQHVDMAMADDMVSDSEQSNAPLTPIQGGDGRWCPYQAAPEPYMVSGYEALAAREYEANAKGRPRADAYGALGQVGVGGYKKATDPVYAGGSAYGQQWAARTLEEQQRAMQSQGGGGYRRDEDEEML